jgi:hypothetical protein
MLKRLFSWSLVAIFTAMSVVCQGTSAVAGTTGSISGTVTSPETKQPIAGAKVTAVSPSETSNTTTDASGHFLFISLAPDTYVVSVESEGYDPTTETGVSVFADQNASLSVALQKTLKTIGRVTTRAAGDLVQRGRTTDSYTVTAAVASAATALGGGGSLTQAYSALAAVPGVYIPQGQGGWAQSVYIRGGNYTELGYEYDGVPIQRSFDQYPATPVSSLGQQNLQVYAGSAPLDSQGSGLAGFINQVIKTGTNPGFVNVEGAIGSPTFYHHAQIEAGGASSNGLFSYYVATAGYNQEFRLIDNYDGASLSARQGTPYNIIASNCAGLAATIGCYSNAAGIFGIGPAGPTGYANGPFIWGTQDQIADRETVGNFHFGIPHKDGTKDDIQLLYDNSYIETTYATALTDWGASQTNVVNGNGVYQGVTYPNCGNVAIGVACAGQDLVLGPPGASVFGPDSPSYANSSLYTGKVGVPLTAASLGETSNYLFPYSNQPVNNLIPPSDRDTDNNRSSILKLQYTKSLGSNAYARVYGYSFYSDWLENGANSNSTNLAGPIEPNYQLIAHTRGAAMTIADQLNAENLLSFNAGYVYSSTVRWNNSTYANNGATVAYAVSSAHPANGICYNASGPDTCDSTSWQYALNGYGTPGLSPTAGSPTVGSIASQTCGGAPCEYLVVDNGIQGYYNTVAPAFTNLSLEDRIRASDKLLLDLGGHYDDFRFNLANATVPAGPEPNSTTALQREFWTNVFIDTNCQDSTTLELVSKSATAKCPAGTVPVFYSNSNPSALDYHAFEPHFGATYSVDPLTVLRASYSKTAQPPSSAYEQYNGGAGAIPLQSEFYPIGFRSSAHDVGPSYSYNLDFSFEHQFKGTDLGLSLSPFVRTTQDQVYDVLLDAKTGFVSGDNVASEIVDGVELAIHKGDFARDGFAAQLSYTFTNAKVHYQTLQNGDTVMGPVNTGVQYYNSFTSGCAKKPLDPRCSTDPNHPADAPCYTTAGVPDPTCAATSVANPYWNSPIQNLFSNQAFYSPVNETFNGSGGDTNSGVTSSYVIPHVVALLLQYKHGPLTFTPTFQMSAGEKYGSPLSNYGIDPSTCTATLAGLYAGTTDPRYTYGLPAGTTAANGYLAQSCAGTVLTPNRFTGSFDTFGEYTEPTNVTGNLAITYQLSKKVTLQATVVNLIDQCFGGSKVPWNNAGPKIGCDYIAGGSAPYAGNYYNPGNSFQSTGEQYPYSPVIGAQVFQSEYSGATAPIQAYLTLSVHL